MKIEEEANNCKGSLPMSQVKPGEVFFYPCCGPGARGANLLLMTSSRNYVRLCDGVMFEGGGGNDITCELAEVKLIYLANQQPVC